MPLNAGNVQASQGLALAIFTVLEQQLGPPLDDLEAEQREDIEEAWQKLAFAIARGVVDHLERDPASESEYAEAFSSSSHDAAFWGWLSGLATVLRNWSSGSGTVADLRTSLDAFFDANATPTQLRGVVR